MKFLCILALLGVLVANIEAKEVVCYIPTWGVDITSKVNTTLCTMFMVSFGTLDASGTVSLPSNFNNFKKLRTPTSKLLLAIGGATSGTYAFSQVASTAANRATFAQNCLNLVQNNGLDGIDIDWEFPENYERANFVALHQDLKNKLGSSYLVTTAVSTGQWLVQTNNVYDMVGLANAVDFINLMTYDMHMDMPWDVSSGVYFNAPVKATFGDSVEKGINYWLQGGAPPSKLTVGVPFYARTYQLSNPSLTAPGSPFVGGMQYSDVNLPPYNVYCPRLQDPTWTKMRDAYTLCPYMYSGNLWVSYEDQQSVIDKGNLANKYNLGGVMLWSLQQDDYDGVCSSCKWPLLKALNSAVGRAQSCSGTSGGGGTTVVVPTTPPPVTSTTTQSSGGGGGYTITTCTSVGLFSYPTDCTKYYNCTAVNQAPFVMPCPPNLYWNRAGYCDWSCNS